MTYFELFSVLPTFDIDLKQLYASYRNLQKKYHPDLFVMESEKEKLASIQKCIEINDAYKTLKDTCLRAEYILLLKGFDLTSESKTFKNSGFLMQQLELREQLGAFTPDDEDKMIEFKKMLAHETNKLEMQISIWISTEKYHDVATNILKMKFFNKLQSELKLAEEKLLDQ